MPYGYDLSDKVSFRLMQGRLGQYNSYNSQNTELDPSIMGVYDQATRLNQHGGNLQQDRMIADRRRSLERALWHSYQGADVRNAAAKTEITMRALINPNKLKPDYDDKVISIPFESGFKVGDVFEWVGTNTYWLIYLQDLTELAYFRGDVRKCSHKISWTDENGKHTTYAAIRGPVETRINSISKHNTIIDMPNYSINFMLPQTPENLEYFKRYSKFYLGSDAKKVCWRVEAIDWLSSPGIIEINAVEYYANETEDDIENGIVGGLIAEPANPNTDFVEQTIEGETFIRPKKKYTYTYNGNLKGEWKIEGDFKPPVNLIPAGNIVELCWNSTYSGQFILSYGESCKKTIVVESLF